MLFIRTIHRNFSYEKTYAIALCFDNCRFSRDVDNVDKMVSNHLQNTLSYAAPIIARLFVVMYVIPMLIIVIALLMIFFLFLQVWLFTHFCILQSRIVRYFSGNVITTLVNKASLNHYSVFIKF